MVQQTANTAYVGEKFQQGPSMSRRQYIDKKVLTEILGNPSAPLSTKEIRAALRTRSLYVPEHKIIRCLREMIRDGRMTFHKKRWSLVQQGSYVQTTQISTLQKTVSPPKLSPIGRSILKLTYPGGEIAEIPSGQQDNGQTPTTSDDLTQKGIKSGPWSTFRSLLAYYKECLRNEEGAEASAYLNDLTSRYIYIHGIGSWFPKPGRPWRYSLPIGEHLSELIENISKAGEGGIIVLGYPLQAVYLQKDNDPDIGFVQPVFQFILEPQFTNGALILSTDDARPEICLEWLKHAFTSPEQQRNFLSACGLINRPRPNDEAPGIETGDGNPGLDNLVNALSAFASAKKREPLLINDISPNPIRPPFDTGIYNRAVIMLGKRTKYTKTLLNELSIIERVDDQTLNSTSLRYVFRRNEPANESQREELVHEGVIADNSPLNAEQRRAAAAIVMKNIAVVTGPPGTGKSQVVCNAVANARIKGQSVLFASRNHKAIDAVVDRLRDDKNRPLIIRTNSKDDPSLNYTFDSAIRDLLANDVDIRTGESLIRVTDEIESLLKIRGEKARLANTVQLFRDQLGELEERMAYLAGSIPTEAISVLDNKPEKFPEKTIKIIKEVVEQACAPAVTLPFFSRFILWINILSIAPQWLFVRNRLSGFPGLSTLPFIISPRALMNQLVYFQLLSQAGEYARLREKAIPLTQKGKGYPALEKLTDSIKDITERLSAITPDALSLHIDSRGGLPSGSSRRENLAALKVALRTKRSGIADTAELAETDKTLKENIPFLLEQFPCWAVTNLSAGSRIPLAPGMFDSAIIDEASQSDIPSAIPILFRAKRAAVVGDPFQLTHTSRLSTVKDSLLRKREGLTKPEDMKFSYTETSLYELFTLSYSVAPIFLCETFRSVGGIADYSNGTFYSGRLRVATDTSKLILPAGISAGIHWTNVSGEVKSSGGSGCYCAEEVKVVFDLVKSILADNNYRGTLGVVTPFRQQANRLRDTLFESDIPYEILERARMHIDTSHGFQGDERDVIIFSLCAGPDMPAGSRAFLRETGNLFNVAVSRARAVLHVVGNRDWAERCGIKHIHNLARPIKFRASGPRETPWHPHESPWEEILYDALREKGLNPVPQHQVANRRLDLALIQSGDPQVKLDIEVDGDRYHRNPDGTRKLEDVWRDIQLQGMGWKVMRFWVYQLREDKEGCVQKILQEWRRDHEQPT